MARLCVKAPGEIACKNNDRIRPWQEEAIMYSTAAAAESATPRAPIDFGIGLCENPRQQGICGSVAPGEQLISAPLLIGLSGVECWQRQPESANRHNSCVRDAGRA